MIKSALVTLTPVVVGLFWMSQYPAIPTTDFQAPSGWEERTSNSKPPRLALDFDPAVGIPLKDIDDAIALHYLLDAHSREAIVITQITTTFGNVDGNATYSVAKELFRRWFVPKSINLFKGATNARDFDTVAAHKLADHQGIVVALGPVTNIAAALELNPNPQWDHLILLGGTERRGLNIRALRTTELNFALDEQSVNRVLDVAGRIPVTVFPMEVCRKVLFTEDDLEGLDDWFRVSSFSWLWISPFVTGRLGFHPWDLLPAIFVEFPKIFKISKVSMKLVNLPWQKGHIHISNATGENDIDVVVDIDVALFRQLYDKTFS